MQFIIIIRFRFPSTSSLVVDLTAAVPSLARHNTAKPNLSHSQSAPAALATRGVVCLVHRRSSTGRPSRPSDWPGLSLWPRCTTQRVTTSGAWDPRVAGQSLRREVAPHPQFVLMCVSACRAAVSTAAFWPAHAPGPPARLKRLIHRLESLYDSMALFYIPPLLPPPPSRASVSSLFLWRRRGRGSRLVRARPAAEEERGWPRRRS